jgi:hypothetical protein
MMARFALHVFVRPEQSQAHGAGGLDFRRPLNSPIKQNSPSWPVLFTFR